MKDELVVVNENKMSPVEVIRMAMSEGKDLTHLEKFIELQERWESNEARKAYHRAMAEFKANPPKINKDKKVSFHTEKGTTSYNHATLANVTGKINSELSKYGLSASWKTMQTNDAITVSCKITHVLGHSEETSLTAGRDKSGSKNDIQALGSTITYLERYTLLAMVGLATFEQDDDGVGSSKKPTVTKPEEKKPSEVRNFECECGAIVSEKIAKFTKDKFGKILCYTCQKGKK